MTVRPLRVLFLEGSSARLGGLLAALEGAGFAVTWDRVDTEEGFARCLGQPFDVVLTRHDLPQLEPTRALEMLRRLGSATPLIIVSGGMQEEEVVAAMKAGAADCIRPERLGRLGVAVSRALERTEAAHLQRAAEAALRESEARYRAVVEDQTALICRWRPDTALTFVNQAFCSLFGQASEALLGTPFIRLVAADDRSVVGDALAQLGGERNQVSWEHRVGDGAEERWLGWTGLGVRDDTGAIVEVQAMGRDITEQREAKVTRKLLEAAVEQGGEAILITDPDGRILYANSAFEEITGYSRLEAVGQTPRILNSGRQEAEFYEQLWGTIRAGRTWRGRFLNRRKDGTLYHEEKSISPVRDAGGAIAHFVSVGRDVSERVELEESLRQAQKMEAIGRLAGGVAHDFNNLVTIIQGYAELLLLRHGDDPDLRPPVEEIVSATSRAASLTRQLLSFSRKETVQRVPLDLNRVLVDFEPMLQRMIGEDVTVVVEPGAEPAIVEADRGQLEQVLLNLSINARDAMPHGGTLSLAVGTETVVVADGDAANPSTRRCWTLSVSDTGVGMDEATRSHIFEPFFTTKGVGRGTGLGLATVYGIVQSSGGRIEVDTAPGRGTTFVVSLPAASQAPATTSQPAGPEARGRGGGATILLVEDEVALGALVQRVLQQEGHSVLLANDREQALDLCRNHRGEIDLVLSDVILPSTTGPQLVDALRELRPTLDVLYMSGYSGDALRSRQVGPLDLLQKPFSREQLIAAIDRRLGDRHAVELPEPAT